VSRALVKPVLAVAALLGLLAACGFSTESRLKGRWETVDTPKRTLDLREDHTYTQRLSGKTLGFLSDMLGPQAGTWKVEGEALVLTFKDDKGAEQVDRLDIHELQDATVVLGDDRWVKKPSQ
jgi:hypothetical protein